MLPIRKFARTAPENIEWNEEKIKILHFNRFNYDKSNGSMCAHTFKKVNFFFM